MSSALTSNRCLQHTLQAISRAYRYGQKKTCLVFKFTVKDSAEGLKDGSWQVSILIVS